MNQNNKKYLVLALAALPLLNSCNDSWLDPKPLSFYTPENTYVDAAGLYSALVACERNMRHEFFTDGAPILTEMYTADIAVHGKTDESGSLVDFDNEMLPARTKNDMKGKNGWYWAEGFKGIKYANIVISRLDAATFKDEAERNAVLGGAYFHRSYRYYKLTHQFGDVPWLSEEITRPKLDFYSYDRWSILEQCKKDMEFAYQWVPEQMDRGRANKDACGMLLMKICMSLGDFDRAIEVGKEVVARHPLMTQRFTTNQNKPNTNLMHDLHSVEAKIDMSNTEGIMYVVAYPTSSKPETNVFTRCVTDSLTGQKGQRSRHLTENQEQPSSLLPKTKTRKLTMMPTTAVASEPVVLRIISSMRSGPTRKRMTCAARTIMTAGNVWKTFGIMSRA